MSIDSIFFILSPPSLFLLFPVSKTFLSFFVFFLFSVNEWKRHQRPPSRNNNINCQPLFLVVTPTFPPLPLAGQPEGTETSNVSVAVDVAAYHLLSGVISFQSISAAPGKRPELWQLDKMAFVILRTRRQINWSVFFSLSKCHDRLILFLALFRF